ncbi:MAG: ROK family transcriptional regulator [Hyphomicrobiales bacterium]|nr:ROK family transcriptional regulator [Hyphomicrobiales bacterium]
MSAYKLGKSNTYTKRLNRKYVLDLIRSGRAASRADATRFTALSPQTVSNIFEELEANRLILATDKTLGQRGQPRKNYRVHPEAGYGIGLHLDDCFLSGRLLDFSYEVGAAQTEPLVAGRPAEVLEQIHSLVERLLRMSGIPARRLWGLGLAAPQLLDENLIEPDLLSDHRWLELSAFGIDRRLSDAFGCPIVMENDANAGAVGAAIFSQAKEIDNFCYIFIGYGAGCGFYRDKSIYRGAWGNAGEIGRLVQSPRDSDRIVESVLSVGGLMDFVDRPVTDFDPVDPGTMFSGDDAARAGDWVDAVVPLLRWTLSVVENMVDPQSILIASHLQLPIIEEMVAKLDPMIHTISARSTRVHPRVQACVINRDSIALGAAALPLIVTLDAEPVNEWIVTGPVRNVYAL